MRLVGEPVAQTLKNAGLPDPGLACKQDDLAIAFTGLLPAIQQEPKFSSQRKGWTRMLVVRTPVSFECQ